MRQGIIERGRGGDVVDEEESVRAQVRVSPEGTVFFLAGRVGEGKEVRCAVDGAGDGVGVFCCVEVVLEEEGQ